MMRRLSTLLLLAFVLGPPAWAACDVISNDQLAGVVAIPDGECRIFRSKGWHSFTVLVVPTSQAEATLTVSANPGDGETVVLGGDTYTFETGAIDAAFKVDVGADTETSMANLVHAVNLTGTAGVTYGTGTTAGDSTAGAVTAGATASGTLTGTTIADTNTVTIGSQVYTFQDTLTEADCNVKVGASDSDSLDNLIAAINGAAGSGTLYAAACTTHPDVTAAAGAGDTMDVTASAAGANGNAIATTATLTAGDWAAVTLTGGTSTILFTAVVPGTDGNALDSTETWTGGAFADTTFNGAAADPVATWSLVLSASATEHGYGADSLTDGVAASEAVPVSWPFYLISSAGGTSYFGAGFGQLP